MTILLEVQNKRWNPGANLVRRPEFQDVDLDRFHGFLARRFVIDTVFAVKRRFYVLRWAPLSLSYLRYKQTHGLSTNIWEATSTLVSSLNYWKRGGIWYVGFNKRRFYPDTRMPIIRVARYVEYGTVKMPARPLFRSVQTYYDRNMIKYMKAFQDGSELK